ncbi:aconitase family protein [Paraburkholderia sp. RAU2J]|uniref:aconitase family protein n=1 Tax=Paraburkholderia sp. RAU2J TaxID=1938810 RepID=UPI001F54742A
MHKTGCNGCITMGQAPATKGISLRTVPRNFPGRSGTREDQVCLVSPETATASALSGVITDPRTLDMPYPEIADPDNRPSTGTCSCLRCLTSALDENFDIARIDAGG